LRSFDREHAETERIRGLLGAAEADSRRLESELESALERIEVLDPGKPSAFGVELMKMGPSVFRFTITNQGPRDVEGPTLNLLFPAAWRISEVRGDGPEVKPARWHRMMSDEPLQIDGVEVPTSLLAYRDTAGPYEVGITVPFFFYVQGAPAGRYPISLRIPKFLPGPFDAIVDIG
jgi:hypothetical protein